MQVKQAVISGAGMCVPDKIVSNKDMETFVNTTDEWIQKRSGIRERRFVDDHTAPSDLGVMACQRALKSAGLNIEDIDMLLVATLSPEHYFPGTSYFMQRKLNMATKPALDLRGQCSGFIYGLSVAHGLLQGGSYKNILLCGVEVHSRALDFSDRGRDTAVLFGDGAGAVVISASDDPERGILATSLHSDGNFAEKLWIEQPGLACVPFLTEESIRAGKASPQMDGPFVFKNAVARLPEVVMESLNKLHLSVQEMDHFFFHQANLRINQHVGESLGIQPDRMHNNIERFGNCSAASIPMCMSESLDAGKIKRGDWACLAAFGSGFTWASAIIRW